MIELRSDEFDIAKPILCGFPYKRAYLYSVFEQKQAGRIFVDHQDRPETALLFHTGGYSLLAGNPHSRSVRDFLVKLTPGKMFRKNVMSLICETPDWDEIIKEVLGERIHEEPRISFRYQGDTPTDEANFRDRLASHEALCRIDASTLPKIPTEINPIHNPNWDSPSLYFKYGIGFCLIVEDREAVSVCYSTTLGKGMAPIKIDTLSDYRRRGYATLTGRAFIEHCCQEGIAPYWECSTDNQPSARLAEKLGFEEDMRFSRYRLRA